MNQVQLRVAKEIHRCADLGLATPDQSLNLYKQISFRRWRTHEPLDNPSVLPIEQPRLLRKAVEMILAAGKKHRDQLSSDLGLHSDTIELLCGLPPKSLGAVGDPSVTEPTLK